MKPTTITTIWRETPAADRLCLALTILPILPILLLSLGLEELGNLSHKLRHWLALALKAQSKQLNRMGDQLIISAHDVPKYPTKMRQGTIPAGTPKFRIIENIK